VRIRELTVRACVVGPALRWIALAIAAQVIVSAQMPSVPDLNGVWILVAEDSRAGHSQVTGKVWMELLADGSNVKSIQISRARGAHQVTVSDFDIEPECIGNSPGGCALSHNAVLSFRARCTCEAQSSVAEQWSLSPDGSGLVIRRPRIVGSTSDEQALTYRRSTTTTRSEIH
jgi:hypothetical protein